MPGAGRMPAVRARGMAILAMMVHGHADPCSKPPDSWHLLFLFINIPGWTFIFDILIASIFP